VEHLTQKQAEDYSSQHLSTAELLAVSDHLGECEACRVRVEGAVTSDVAFLALHDEAFSEDGFESSHLTAEQTADYVDRNLPGEAFQMAEDHLSGCETCAFAVADLRTFRNEIAPSLDRQYGPAAVPPESGWRQKFASLFKIGPIPAFATAGLAVLLLATIAWLAWRTQREQHQEVATASPAPVVQPTASPEPTLQPQSAPPVVAQLNDGEGVLSLDQDGKLSGADSLPPSYQSLVKKALTSQRIDRSSQLQGLTRPSSSLMGADNKPAFSVLEPVGSVLMSERPAFRWSAMEGATGYVVEVYDDQFKLAASSPQLTARSWTTPPSLPRGKVYSWQVKAIKDGEEVTSPRPPAPQAKFRILDQVKANEIARAKRAYASSHLTLGLLYAEAGLLKEAEQEFRLLRRANPNSDLARTLLRQVQALK